MKGWHWKAVPVELRDRLPSPEQRELFDLLAAGLSFRQASEHRGRTLRNTAAMVARMRQFLNGIGYDPERGMTMVSPEPQFLKGRSALVKVNDDGTETTKLYWNKTGTARENQAQAFVDAIKAAADGMAPFPRVAAPARSMDDLCSVYTITDFHLGAYCWADETGASWDMKIAETVLLNAMADMMDATPQSETAIFAQIGDLLHWDGLLALTPTAKNVLDADTRFPLLVETAIRVLLRCVEMLLHKHKRVHVIMAEGNHDMASSVWLRAIMAAMFRQNSRVTVESSPFPFYAFVHGQTFIGWHHGHLQKMDQLPLLFATDPRFKSEYGKCLHTYIHTGHMHHQRVIERGGIIVEQHPTLSARDAHGARGFLYSNRATRAITYHKTRGEISRCTVLPNFSEGRE